MKAFHEAMKDHQHTEELRLGYVTFTRPRSLLLGSGHWWGPSQRRPRGPSGFLLALYEHCAAGYGEIEAWADEPAEDEENPALSAAAADHVWPLPLDDAALARRRSAAETVLAHLERGASSAEATHPATHGPTSHNDPEWPPPPDEDALRGEPPLPDEHLYADGGFPEEDLQDSGGRGDRDDLGEPRGSGHSGIFGDPGTGPDRELRAKDRPSVPHQAPAPDEALPHPAEPTPLTPEEARTVGSWDRDLDALTGELLRARRGVTEVPLPASLTAVEVLRLASDPDGFAQELARPMPRPPQSAARRGIRFHAWIEARFEELRLPMLEPGELPGGQAEIADERDLEELKDAFERTPYAHRTPYRVEAPFQLAIAGRVVRGRIDAVYREDDGGGARYEIVDWKTSRSRTADPLQLAIYRLAWAEQQGVPPHSVGTAFVYVRTGEVVRPDGLPDRAELERLLLGEPGADPHGPPADGPPYEPPDEYVRGPIVS
jgi:DNA helicase-2/ATP-dependent DNA helicase PcrA